MAGSTAGRCPLALVDARDSVASCARAKLRASGADSLCRAKQEE